jgi:hypothetical protein
VVRLELLLTCRALKLSDTKFSMPYFFDDLLAATIMLSSSFSAGVTFVVLFVCVCFVIFKVLSDLKNY